MVNRKKGSSSAPKSKKQQTILDLFPKKGVSVIPQDPASPLPSSSLPTTPAASTTDEELDPRVVHYVSSSPEPGPVASTSEAGPIKLSSSKTSSNKLHSPRSVKPAFKGESRPPDSLVIDLTLHSESPTPFKTQPASPKPTYSIFAPRPKPTGPLSDEVAAVLPPPAKQKYPLFNIQPVKPPKTVSSSKVIATEAAEAPFPRRDSQHVRGPQTAFATSTHWRRSSEKPVQTPPSEPFQPRMDTSEGSALRTLTRISAPSFWEKEKCIESIPSEHKLDHPAIARLAASITSPPDASSFSEKLWSERWRPQRADGVLGNEANTVYLRDWLRALEVRFENSASLEGVSRRPGTGSEEPRGAKRPQVMRSVARAKKRQRRSSDGFIVSDASDYSSEVEGSTEADGDDEDGFQPSPRKDDAASAQTGSNIFGDHLANTIILFGPSGSGKTTAVYSCAEELGWEVFEVYPGIGKRNGASLDTLIGEVGKNHLVRKTQARAGLRRSRDEEVDPDNSDDFGFVTSKRRAGIRQSVILLEEVDILYKEDANFWPAVIRFIKDCKRAVILTCNELSLVPTSELPLQTLLEYRPCPAEVAGSYLHGLCCAEGHIVDRSVLTKLYAQGYDLRHTIHRLQMLCQGFPLGSRAALDWFLDWDAAPRQSVPHADLISFVDAYMMRDPLDRPTALALTRYEHGADAEMGFPVLADALDDGYGIYEWDTKIIDAVMSKTHGTRVPRGGAGTGVYLDLVNALRDNAAFPVGAMDRTVAHTEYVPWARQLIAMDDALEGVQRRGAGRSTRNSARHVRSISLDDGGRAALVGSSLG